MEDATRDNNRVKVALLENDDGTPGAWLADNATGYALMILYPADAPTALDTYKNDNNRVHPVLLEDDADSEPLPWMHNSSNGAWVTIS